MGTNTMQTQDFTSTNMLWPNNIFGIEVWVESPFSILFWRLTFYLEEITQGVQPEVQLVFLYGYDYEERNEYSLPYPMMGL